MANIPTISEIYQNIANDLKNKLNLSDSELKLVLDAFAAVISAQLKLNYLYLSDIANNVFPDTADSEANGGTLNRHGLIQLGRLQLPATNGVFMVKVTSVVGSVLRAGLTFKSNDNSLNPGKVYILDVEKITSSAEELVEIRSIDGGVDYALLVGDVLTITEPVIGVEQTVVVDSITEQPLAAESEDIYRQRIINSIQLEPQGGSKTDYRLWASDAQGVRNVYPYVKDFEAGTVQVFVEATEIDSTDENGTPTPEILQEVDDVIRFDPDDTKPLYERGRLPIQAELEVLPVITNPVDVTITGLEIDTIEIRTSIESNLKEYLKKIRPFVAGGDLARNKNDILYLARLQSVVTDVISSSNFFVDFSMQVNGNDLSSYLFSKENIPYLRNLTFN